MLKYGIIGLLSIVFVYTAYQLYLNTIWTKWIRNKQSEYTNIPTVTSNNKRLYHTLEVCTLAIAAVFFLPTASMNNATAEMARVGGAGEQNGNAMESDIEVFSDFSTDDVEAGGQSDSESMAYTTSAGNITFEDANKNVYREESSVFGGYLGQLADAKAEVDVSLEMLNPSAEYLSAEDFRRIFSKAVQGSTDAFIETTDYIVSLSGDTLEEEKFLLRIEEDRYVLCNEEEQLCYYAEK